MSAHTSTMRAIQQDAYGTPDVLHLVELPRPEPRASEILVRVHAAGLNPADWKSRAGLGFLRTLPLVLGWDVSGVVEAVGVGVTIFEPGDEVFGMLPFPDRVGAFAEYVTAPARAFTIKPPEIDHLHAGAIPLAALTAWQALVDTAGVRSGQRVLIHAAAGGVGHFAVQIAKAFGATVIGTASAGNQRFLGQIGVDEPIDYHTTDFATAVRDVDIVLDTIGRDYTERSLDTLREGGTVVTIAPTGQDDLVLAARQRGLRIARLLVEADHQGMTALAGLVQVGVLRPTIAATFPLSDAAKAHQLGETGHTVGKIVLTVR
ncbi:NADP-dependent oxidoreductase [Nocardia sp. JMUB6875]|uniref:NADP-dependent oxidoreductase n=1 Tax=Nocardia sp. JMUB6875 TaxID=3158170 RepID=UPI0032E57F08